eukprot:scaffold65868_cov32-Tisochrysis_lutea.AAC.2
MLVAIGVLSLLDATSRVLRPFTQAFYPLFSTPPGRSSWVSKDSPGNPLTYQRPEHNPVTATKTFLHSKNRPPAGVRVQRWLRVLLLPRLRE